MQQQIIELLSSQSQLMPAQIAEQLGVSEWQVVEQLGQQKAILPLTQLDELMTQLPEYGPMTTIINIDGNIFEFKGPFPKGKYGHGYYNIYSKGEGLHGHLKLTDISAIALVSRPFRGQQSYSFNFFNASGKVIFKVYLGRDSQRQLFAEQVNRFQQLFDSVE